MPGDSNLQDRSFICRTCGTGYPPSSNPPERCPICEDERQFVGPDGQQWLTPAELRETHRNVFHQEEPNLHSFITEPAFGIGQRAFIVQTSEGNLLWDCLALIDDATKEAIRKLGGIQAIAISHPHYYTTMLEWSHEFGDIPIHLHTLDRKWVMNHSPNIRFWDGTQQNLFGQITLVKTGGHFDGFQVALWPNGAEGRGVLLAGDQPQVCADTGWVTFMYSYPNYIPLGPTAVNQITAALQPLAFDRIYGPFPHKKVQRDAKQVIARSASRFLKAMSS